MRWNIAGVGELMDAFGRREAAGGVAEHLPERLDRAPSYGSELPGYRTAELGTRALDPARTPFTLCPPISPSTTTSPGRKVWREDLIDVGQEACAVDCGIENAGRGEDVVAERSEERPVFQ
jgi:hypothetical protein